MSPGFPARKVHTTKREGFLRALPSTFKAMPPFCVGRESRGTVLPRFDDVALSDQRPTLEMGQGKTD